jgi:hypothetical protein
MVVVVATPSHRVRSAGIEARMSSSVSFAEFAAGSPHADALERKALLFVYRAIEDLAAEQRVHASDLTILEAIPSNAHGMPLARLRARVRSLRIDDALASRSDDLYDVIVAGDVAARDAERVLTNFAPRLEPAGIFVMSVQSGIGARGFSPVSFEALARKSGLDVHRFMNAGFVLGRSRVARRWPVVGSFDADFANLIPAWMASGWFAVLRRRG